MTTFMAFLYQRRGNFQRIGELGCAPSMEGRRKRTGQTEGMLHTGLVIEVSKG
jgi:hypothetical protein